MKKIFKLFVFVTIIISTTLLCGCDLSHKHYADAYGYCASCETDTAELLTRGRYNKYTSLDKDVGIEYQEDSYYKFVSNGEQGINIQVVGAERNTYSVYFYSRTTSSFFLEPNIDGSWTCYTDLTKDTTYYVKINYRNQGKAHIIIQDLAYIVEE